MSTTVSPLLSFPSLVFASRHCYAQISNESCVVCFFFFFFFSFKHTCWTRSLIALGAFRSERSSCISLARTSRILLKFSWFAIIASRSMETQMYSRMDLFRVNVSTYCSIYMARCSVHIKMTSLITAIPTSKSPCNL